MPLALRPTAAPALAALLAVAALAVPAQRAAAQSTDAVIHACYVPSTGTVYRIKAPGAPDACYGPQSGAKQHVPFQWNEQGPAGPPGPAGPQGPAGPAGTGGTAAPVLRFDQTNIAIDPTRVQSFRQTCPTGKRVLDRGYLLLDASGNPLVNPVGVTVIGDFVSAPPTFSTNEPPPVTQSRSLMVVNQGPRVVQVQMQLTCAFIE